MSQCYTRLDSNIAVFTAFNKAPRQRHRLTVWFERPPTLRVHEILFQRDSPTPVPSTPNSRPRGADHRRTLEAHDPRGRRYTRSSTHAGSGARDAF